MRVRQYLQLSSVGGVNTGAESAPSADAFNPNLIEIEGQSNAAGAAPLADLPAELIGTMSEVMIFETTRQRWEALNPGVNSRGDVNNQTAFYGIEARLMYLLRTLRGRSQYVVKWAVGGTKLATQSGAFNDWNPSNVDEMYSRSNRNLYCAQHGIGDHRPPRFIIWIQGEADCNTTDAPNYQANLTAFISAKRTAYGYTIPFIIVRLGNLQTAIGDAPSIANVRAAQAAVVAAVTACYLVDADTCAVDVDNIHYNAAGIETLAQRVYTCITTNGL